MFAGQGARVVVQAIYFVVIARALDVQGYGAFVGVTAIVAIAAPFSGWGSGGVLIQNVARDRGNFPRYWGNALVLVVLTGTLLTVLLAALSPRILPSPVPLALLLAVSVADLIFGRVLEVSGQAFQAVHQLQRTASLFLLPNLLRLVFAVGLLWLYSSPSVLIWGYLYLIAMILCGVAGMLLVMRELGRPHPELDGFWKDCREGFDFAVGASAQSIYNDIDKAMLARLSTLAAAGVYGAAYRIVEVAFVPVRSLLFATYTDFYKHGELGLRSSIAFARRLLWMAGGYSVLAAVGLFSVAPALPLVLGNDFQDAVPALRWLAVLPLLKTLQYLPADALTGSGHQRLRTGLQIGVALLNVVLNLWLVPIYSWTGAAGASLLSDGVLALGLWACVWYLLRQSPPAHSDSPAQAAKSSP